MINLADRQPLHDLIVLDFAVRTLQHDYAQLEKLKTKSLYMPLHEGLLKQIRKDYIQLKNHFKKKRIAIVGWKRIDVYFSDIQIATSGEDQVLRYANQALKVEVEKLLAKYMVILKSYS